MSRAAAASVAIAVPGVTSNTTPPADGSATHWQLELPRATGALPGPASAATLVVAAAAGLVGPTGYTLGRASWALAHHPSACRSLRESDLQPELLVPDSPRISAGAQRSGTRK